MATAGHVTPVTWGAVALGTLTHSQQPPACADRHTLLLLQRFVYEHFFFIVVILLWLVFAVNYTRLSPYAINSQLPTHTRLSSSIAHTGFMYIFDVVNNFTRSTGFL